MGICMQWFLLILRFYLLTELSFLLESDFQNTTLGIFLEENHNPFRSFFSPVADGINSFSSIEPELIVT